MSILEHKRRVVLAPGDVEARCALAEAFAAGGQLKAARDQLTRCLALQPAHPGALRLLARVQQRLGEFGAAQRALSELLQSLPEDAEALASLSESLEAEGRPDDALLYALECARLSPERPQRLARAAELARSTRRPALARVLLERALARCPGDTRVREARSELLKQRGEEDALDLLGALDPAHPLAPVGEALVQEELGLAKRLWVELPQHLRESAEGHLMRGELLTLEGDPERASHSFERARAA
ncbi:MAG: tetratricopeptide repeat protein, partial [Myxococcaceae bacterium]